ncbi:GNAT family N-acetyltransferase [Macrococcus equi]|uniref:GNAT family N-acetyltransferase n=1 Tax=Macrococcus equi TaxID=3395462 RepID=UPI0039BDB875
MKNISIKPVTHNDLEALIHISKKTFDETFRPNNNDKVMDDYLATSFTHEKMLEQINNPHSEFYFVYYDNQIAGYLKINIKDAQTEEMGSHAMEIERIYVDQSFQKLGIGKFLYNFALERAHFFKAQKIWLGVWEYNINALAFYKKMGCKHVDSHIFQMGDEAQTDLIMEKIVG